jgi:hypothetical protein
MKMGLKIASVLTWFNLIFWGLITGFMLLAALGSASLPVLLIPVLMSAIPLNCYAALKLHASIRRPGLPLSNQTPVGIRFVGFIALFFGISCLGDGFVWINNTKEVLDMFKDQLSQVPQMAQMPRFKSLTVADFRWGGVFVLILGLCIVINVVLNLRLLRWYYLVKKSDVS